MIRVLLVFLCFTGLAAQAQINNQCVDSNRINPYYQCNEPTFNPVCGCNNVTYRNGCEMTNIGGVNYPSQYENGVCSNDGFYYFISPIPATDKINFSMQFAANQETSVTVQIIDIYGYLVFSQNYTNISTYPTTPQSIYLRDLKTGVYTFVVLAGGQYRYTKFLKYTY